MMRLPLTHFTLCAASLPDRLLDDGRAGFSLPGADALEAFAELLGGAPQEDAPAEGRAPFALPSMLPDDVSGSVSLTREIDFGSLRGDRALLELDHLAGSGEVLLGDQVLARFGGSPASGMAGAAELTGTPCMLALDLTHALNLGRRQTLTLRFDEARPAGVCGPVMLVATEHAHLARVVLTPDARSKAVAVRARVSAQREGRYVLRALPVAPGASAAAAREIRFSLAEHQTHEAALTLALEAETFIPGQVYSPSALKLQLFLRPERCCGEGVLCDEALLLCGYPARHAHACVPLSAQDCADSPDALAQRLGALHVSCVLLPAPATDCLQRALCRAGIAVQQALPHDSPLRPLLARYPHVTLPDAPPCPSSPELDAWLLCAMVAFPRTVDETLSPRELLAEAAGRALDPGEEGVRGVLSWLGAVLVRLRAEAARQGRFTGALCAPGALEHADVRDALRTAFAPLHLSALPLFGAWWTGTRFSASLHAFLPPDETRALTAVAVLEDENGKALAQLSAPCPRSGSVGVLEAALPPHACVLTLSCRLLHDGKPLEESTLPVYVGERGPLEAAFA